MSENGNTSCQHPCDAGKAVQRGKFIVVNVYIKNELLKQGT
jgi:hypothetical protein